MFNIKNNRNQALYQQQRLKQFMTLFIVKKMQIIQSKK